MKSLEDLEKAFDRGLSAYESSIAVSRAKKMGKKIEREVKKVTPWDTGNLTRHWNSSVEKESGDIKIVIENDAEYAAPVNNGHRVVVHGKTTGYKDGSHMLEKGMAAYKENYLKDDLEAMIDEINKKMKGG